MEPVYVRVAGKLADDLAGVKVPAGIGSRIFSREGYGARPDQAVDYKYIFGGIVP